MATLVANTRTINIVWQIIEFLDNTTVKTAYTTLPYNQFYGRAISTKPARANISGVPM